MVGFVASIAFAANPGFVTSGPAAIATFAPADAIDASSPIASVAPVATAIPVRIRARMPPPRPCVGGPIGPSTPTDGRSGGAGDTRPRFLHAARGIRARVRACGVDRPDL